ncbi:MAG TPA: SpoIVB peptidase S55 domain-containing protein [Clostridia bacterium]|nr:SpoIVB peptidase S55 domain-containing protein [Clostridia bacterium]
MRHSRFSAASATLFALVLFCTGASLAIENKLNVPIMPLKDVKIGMRGEAYTVFTGTVPEKMEVEVLGVMRNMAGPKGDVILVRLHGEKAEYTGVVAGMSGSPVYIDGKLVGALAYRIGEFSKEPIGALTPIQSMLEINDMDTTPGSSPIASPAKTSSPVPAAGAGAPAALPGSQPLVSYLKPIETPLVFNGFSEEAIRLFAPQFAAAGVMPVMGAGSSSDVKQPEPLQAGSAVGAVLVRGDMDIAATCTVTYVDEDHLLACGHPFLNYGQVSMPMTKSQVLATLPSPANAFKIANTTETVGSFVQDRKTGILGRFGKDAQMIPVTLNLHATGRDRTLRFEVLNNARLTPAVMMAAVFNGIQGNNDYGEDVTFRVKGAIEISGHPRLEIGNMYAPAEGGTPTGQQIAAWVGERFSRIFDNPYERPDILGVTLNVDLIRERRWAKLETARTDVTEARPGEEIMVETVVRPYRGERIVRQIPIRIPTSAPRGTLRILVSDGDTLDRMRRMGTPMARKYDLASTIAMLNKEHANSSIYVSLLQSNPQAVVEDKVMPALPLSVMNVMDGMRGTQDMVVTAESSIEEASTSLDYVVSGAKVLTVAVR